MLAKSLKLLKPFSKKPFLQYFRFSEDRLKKEVSDQESFVNSKRQDTQDQAKDNEKKNSYFTGLSKEEFDEKLQTIDDNYHIFEISPESLAKIKRAKRISVYFNIPVSMTLTFLGEPLLSGLIDYAKFKSLIFVCDYTFFLFGLTTLTGLRNIVLSCHYHKSIDSVTFVKLGYFNQKYKVTLSVTELERIYDNTFTPFMSLKSKINNEGFSMNGTGTFLDLPFYNHLFPYLKPIPQAKKGPMLDRDRLPKKNIKDN